MENRRNESHTEKLIFPGESMLLSKIAIFNVIIREKEILKFNAINKKYFPGFPQLPQYIFPDRLDTTILIILLNCINKIMSIKKNSVTSCTQSRPLRGLLYDFYVLCSDIYKNHVFS